MRNNKAILDEAARSVRRTFIGSVAGSLGMLVIVGAAGAYGMPEKLTTQVLSAAMAKLSVKFPHAAQLAAAPTDRTVALISEEAPRESAASPAGSAKRGPVVMTVIEDSAVVRTMPTVEPAPAVVAMPAPAASAPIADPLPVATMVPPSKPEPAPAITASVSPRVVPETSDRSIISAPMIFEAPKLADIKPLEPMPDTEPVTSAPAQPARPTQQASLAALEPMEFPQTAFLPMPLAKPPLTPAQRLDLSGKEYDKAEKCLAQAIYFEARNEPARGQMAVAQVVLNRVFSPHYPKDVCSVVYQNAHRHLSCQFTFACDGKPESIREFGAWQRATRIAKQALEAKIWLPDVAKATHYHAAYVRPIWIRDMKVMSRYGLHTFYRPRNWGDGASEPAWGAGVKKAKS